MGVWRWRRHKWGCGGGDDISGPNAGVWRWRQHKWGCGGGDDISGVWRWRQHKWGCGGGDNISGGVEYKKIWYRKIVSSYNSPTIANLQLPNTFKETIVLGK